MVFSGAIAVIKVNGVAVGLMKDIRINESSTRVIVRGLGSILPKESVVTAWAGTCSCSFYEIDYASSGIQGAIRRDVAGNAGSQIAAGNNQTNFEDNLVLDQFGVTLDVYKKVKDIIDPNTGLIIPKIVPYCIIGRAFLESDAISLSEGSVVGRDQAFSYLDPVIF